MHVVVKSRSIGIDSNGHQNLIQTDAAINAGNSEAL